MILKTNGHYLQPWKNSFWSWWSSTCQSQNVLSILFSVMEFTLHTTPNLNCIDS